MLLNQRIHKYLEVCGITNEVPDQHLDKILQNISCPHEQAEYLNNQINLLRKQSKYADALQISGVIVIATQLAKYSKNMISTYSSLNNFFIESSSSKFIADSFFNNFSNLDFTSLDLSLVSDLLDGASLTADIVDGLTTFGLGLAATYAAKKAGQKANAELEKKYIQLKRLNNDKNTIHSLLTTERNIKIRKDKVKNIINQYPNQIILGGL